MATLKEIKNIAINPELRQAGEFYLSMDETEKDRVRDAFMEFDCLMPDDIGEAERGELYQHLNVFCGYFRIGDEKPPLPLSDEMCEALDLIEKKVALATEAMEHPDETEKYAAKLAAIDEQIKELARQGLMNIIVQCDTDIVVEGEQQKAILDWATKEWEEVKEPSIDDIAIGLSRFSPEDRHRIYIAAHGIMGYIKKYAIPRPNLRRMIALTRELQLMRAAQEEEKMMAPQYGRFYCLLTNW